jgi:copper resistance protein C
MRINTALDLHKRGIARSIFALLILESNPAVFAHTAPVSMMPAADATVAYPQSIMIHFSGALEPKFSSITVTNVGGHVVNKEPSVVSSDNKVMTVALPALEPGIYTVHWVGVSVDTHRSQGDYKFTVK